MAEEGKKDKVTELVELTWRNELDNIKPGCTDSSKLSAEELCDVIVAVEHNNRYINIARKSPATAGLVIETRIKEHRLAQEKKEDN